MTYRLERIQLAHGSGGLLMQELIQNLLLKKLYNPILSTLDDGAILNLKTKRVAFTTDSFVVSPPFFKGADIGKLAVCGTINDLVVQGAVPRFISLALILEEGLEFSILEKILDSIAKTSKKENIYVVTGDLKVVEKGACDKIFINTTGIGELIRDDLSIKAIRPEDKIIISGCIGEHGLSVLSGRKNQGIDFGIKSDCSSLASLIIPLLKETKGIKFMRDPTRGGLAGTLNEISSAIKYSILLEEEKIPIKDKVRSASELLGIDPLYLANEGKAVLVVDKRYANSILKNLRKHPLGKDSAIIGEIIEEKKGKVLLKTVSSGIRILEPPLQDLLPRIC
jgi:hydrogenase expression/formation protein HypE